MRLVFFAVAVAGVLFLPGCSAPLVPSPYVSRSEREREPDAQLMAELRSSWFALQQRGLSEEEYSRHVAEYNYNLLLLVRRYRADMLQAFREGNHDYEVPGIDLGNLRREDRQRLRDVFEDMVPAADIRTRSLADRFSIIRSSENRFTVEITSKFLKNF